MSKKILFVITKANWGGAQHYVFDMAKAMQEKGYEVTVAAGTVGLLAEKLKKVGIPFREISGMGRDMHILSSDIRAFFSLAKIIREEKPDILHLNSPKAGGMGAFLGRVFFTPVIVYTAHGWPFNEDRPLWQKAFIQIFSYLTTALTHRTIVIHRDDQRATRFWFGVKFKISLVHNGIEEFPLKTREEARALLLPTHKENFWVGAIAELHPSNRLSSMISAVVTYNRNHENKLTFVIIGEGEEREKLETLIKKEGATKEIYLAGFQRDAASLLRAFDVFLFVPYKVGLPYVLLEAGLAGLPVIANRNGGIPDIIENDVTGILLPRSDISSIAQALEKLFSNYSHDTGERLKEKIKRDFSLSRCVNETMALYES